MESSKTLLSKQEIQRSLNCLKEIFSFIEKKTSELGIPDVLKNPQISPKVSESIAYYLLRDEKLLSNFIDEIKSISFGGSESDILINKKIKIEIKATRKDFQYFSNKDVTCNFLIWIDFKNYFENSNYIKIYVLPKPNEKFKNQCKISLDKFKKICSDSLKTIDFDLSQFN